MTADAAPVAVVQPKAKIFISYSRKDMAFADRLEAALKARGFEPLIDRTEIYAFEDWWKRIEGLIGRADTVVFVLSPDAVKSDVALKEVGYAASLNKRFAPIVCRRTDDGAVPEALRRLNFIFFDDPPLFEASADKLAEALQSDIGWIRRHTEFGEAARRWVEGNRAGGLLLRSPMLDQAEAWMVFRPPGAPLPAAETQTFIAASRKAEVAARRRNRILNVTLYTMFVSIILGLVGWIKQDYLIAQWRWWTVTWPYARVNVRPYVLSKAKEEALKVADSFRECAPKQQNADYCPDMIVVPAGLYTMGGPTSTPQQPQHLVTIAKPFAVSKYELTFAEWDACVAGGGCNGYKPGDQGFGRKNQPVINVSWDDAQAYAAWLSQVTGKTYRLLSEAEYEYATRAGTTTAYPWGDDIKLNGQAMANCDGCGSKWDARQTAPVGSFPPNNFSLYDMVGNVEEWNEDCVHSNYNGAPTNGSAWIEGGDCSFRMAHGGHWQSPARDLESARRTATSSGGRGDYYGFRVARTLDVAALTKQQIGQLTQQQHQGWCTNDNNKFSSDLQIVGCTALIQSSKLKGDELMRAYGRRAIAYYYKGDYDNAIADLSEYIKLNPKDPLPYSNRGRVYYLKGDYDSAIADCSEAIKLDPKFASAYNNRGQSYAGKGDYDRAIADYSEAIKLDPKDATIYNNRGSTYSDKGDYDDAIADFSEAIRLNPKDATTYDNRGLAYRRKGDLDRAIADYTQAIALDPKNAIAYYRRGFAYSRKGNLDGAIANYTQAIALDAKFDAAYDYRGNAYSDKRDYDRAIADYTQAIALDPKNATYYADRGDAYSSKKDYARAIADYTQTIALDPKNANALNGRCYDNAIIGQLQAALADCNRSLQLRPNDAGTLDSRGLTYLKLGQFDNAIADYNAALKVDPKMASSLYGRGVAEIKKGDTAAGNADIAAAKAIQADVGDQMAAFGITL